MTTLRHLQQEQKFSEWISSVYRSNSQRSIDLESLLITPIQRVPRYVLLLSEVVKHTPATHPDQADLAKALQSMRRVADVINERKRDSEKTSEVLRVARQLINDDGQPIDV